MRLRLIEIFKNGLRGSSTVEALCHNQQAPKSRIGDRLPTALDSGKASPLGAEISPDGVNFAVYSENASLVYLCIIDPEFKSEIARLPFPNRTGNVWHGFMPNATAGLHYCYRMEGSFSPKDGHYFDVNRLLVDPYAKALQSGAEWCDLGQELELIVPACVVTEPLPKVEFEDRPVVSINEMVIYEAHVKGLSALRMDIDRSLRGTYSALGSKPIIDHFLNLGVTTVELLPCQAILDERRLAASGIVKLLGI